jgi:hypothetical protein
VLTTDKKVVAQGVDILAKLAALEEPLAQLEGRQMTESEHPDLGEPTYAERVIAARCDGEVAGAVIN